MITKFMFGLILTFNILTLQGQDFGDAFITTNDIVIDISATDSVTFPDYFDNQQKIDSIIKQFDNRHLEALAIEENQIELYKPEIKIEGVDRVVSLKDGSKIRLSPNEMHDEYGYTFEKAFKDNNFLLFRVQWFEGNNYFLLNTVSGEKTYTFGRVFISPNRKYFISINDDIDVGYSSNGLQLFMVDKKDNLKEIWEHSPSWAPENIKWINNHTLITKGYYHDEHMEVTYFYKKIKFNGR